MSQASRGGDGLTKFQRYRQRQQHRGMKMLRIWVPDTRHPEFLAEARRQGEMLRGRSEEVDATSFIVEAFDWPEP